MALTKPCSFLLECCIVAQNDVNRFFKAAVNKHVGRKEADASQPYQEFTADVLESSSSAFKLVGYESDKSTSADNEEDEGPARNSEELSNSSSVMQYFPISGMIFVDALVIDCLAFKSLTVNIYLDIFISKTQTFCFSGHLLSYSSFTLNVQRQLEQYKEPDDEMKESRMIILTIDEILKPCLRYQKCHWSTLGQHNLQTSMMLSCFSSKHLILIDG